MLHQESLFGAHHHPIAVRAPASSTASELRHHIRENRRDLELLLERHAAVLFRGFHVKTAEDFAGVTGCFTACPNGYIGGNSPRTRVAGDIYTSTEYPASERISLHNEMSYLPRWPNHLLFQCAVAPASGGQTTLAHAGDVLASMPLRISDALRERKLCYVRTMQANDVLGKGWKTTYGTDDKASIERTIRAQGSTYAWLARDVLQVRTHCEPFTRHPRTQQEVWFNQAEQWHPSALNPGMRRLIQEAFGGDGFPHDCRFGDGSPIPDQLMAEIREVLGRNTLLFDWQEGDLLVLDNVLAMHGREAFTGPRRIHVFLAE